MKSMTTQQTLSISGGQKHVYDKMVTDFQHAGAFFGGMVSYINTPGALKVPAFFAGTLIGQAAGYMVGAATYAMLDAADYFCKPKAGNSAQLPLNTTQTV